MTFAKADQLKVAIDAVYQTFKAPVPFNIEGCPCCVGTRGVDALLTTPLREISGQQLWRYVSGVFLTIGSQRDFRYLLPRILEISVSDSDHALNSEIVIGKLGRADWLQWPESEQAAIRTLLDLWFELALSLDLEEAEDGFGISCSEAEGVLCGGALAGLTLDPWLERLQQADVALVLDHIRSNFPTQPNGFWEDAPECFAKVSGFLGR